MFFIFDLFKKISKGMVFEFGGSSGGGGSYVTETADMQAQAGINQNLWNYYQESYAPQIAKYADTHTNAGTQDLEKKQVAGQIRGEMMKNVDPSKMTANPVENAKMLNRLSTLETGAQVQGQGGEKSRQIKDMENVIDIGRGQATSAQTGLGEIAGQSVSAEIANVELQQARTGATENAVGSVAGAIGAGLLRSQYSNGKSLMTPEQIAAIS